jgi:hypothetical protein
LESTVELRPLTTDELSRRAVGICKIAEMDLSKHADLVQKSRVMWAKAEDENSSYFHGIIRANTRNCRLHDLSIEGS